MSLADLPEALLQTILHQVAVLLLSGARGDMDAARHAAAATLSTYDPQTEPELRLAARVISFSLQAGEALAQAADPDMPLTRVIRLRSGAVSLSREADKAERRLERLREVRFQAMEEAATAVPESEWEEEAPVDAPLASPSEDSRKVAAYAEANGLSWSDALKQRRREQRLAERRRKLAMRGQAA